MNRLGGFVALAALLTSTAPGTAAGHSIVGTWGPDPMACTPVAGMISIGPLSLTADETSCLFSDVSRSADTVTWHGRCSDGEASRASTTVASRKGEELVLTMNGARSGPYRRCSAD